MSYGAAPRQFYLLIFLLPVLSGSLLAFGWPPAASFPLIFIAFVPLLYLNELLPAGRRGAMIGMAGTSFALLMWNVYATQWIYKTAFNSGIAINCINVALFTIPWALYFVAQNRLNRLHRYLLLVSAWISLELMHYHWGLSFPYLTLGNGLAAVPALAQWYEYTGVFGGSLWIWAVNVLLYELLREVLAERTDRRRLFGRITYALAAVLSPAGVSLVLFASYAEQGKSVEVIAVHPNLDCRKERKTFSAEELIKVHWSLTEKHLRDSTRYILWPENSLNLGWVEELAINPRLSALRDRLKNYPNTQLITGAILYERYRPVDLARIPVNTRQLEVNQQKVWYNTYNSALQLNAGPEVLLRTKVHLVPLEETTVYPVLINFARKFIPSLGGMSFSTRSANQHLFHNRETVSPLICYESFFGNTVRKFVNQGGNLLFVILNEGWIDDDQQAMQFMQYASLRAIENRRSIVRSSNKGITCFIDQKGMITQATIDKAALAITGNALVNKKKTFYTMTGDYMGWLSVLVFASYLPVLIVALIRVIFRSSAQSLLLKRAG